MGLVLNMVGSSGSGGGGLVSTEAVVTVTLDVGSTVTMTKGGESLTPVSWTQAADANVLTAIFTVQSSKFDSQNAWTLTATDGVATITQNLTVSAALVYAVDLRMWTGQIYTDGNQWTRITGGLQTFKGVSSGTYSVGTINYGEPPSGVINITLGSNKSAAAITTNKIDVTGYNYLNVDIETNNFATNRIFIAIANSDTALDWTTNGTMVAKATPGSNNFTGTLSCSLTGISGEYYVAFGGYGNYQCTASKIYLTVNAPT